MKPILSIDLNKYKDNIDYLTDILHKHNLSVTAVSKVYDADEKLIQVINQTMVDHIADSRIEHLKHVVTNKPKILLRIAKLSEVMDVVRYADLSLQSEIKTIKALNDAAEKEHKNHQIILMFDIGDLREGIFYRDHYDSIIQEILALQHIKLKGIGCNLTCYGGILPTIETYERLEAVKEHIESTYHIHLDLVSGGNSSSLPMVFSNQLPSFINHLRIGEAFVLGRETAYGNPIKNMHDDVFTLKAEIIELKYKPSLPEGIIGMNAFGEQVQFFDQGEKHRAILGIGRLEVSPEHLIPPQGIEVIGASSDHLIVHIENNTYQLGDMITFNLTYGGILSLSSAKLVEKVYV